MSPRWKVLVGAPLVGDHLRALEAIAELEVAERATGFTFDEIYARISDADAIVVIPSQRVDAALLARANRLAVVSCHSVGVDNVDLEACRARGIVVTNTPGVLTEATADLAFGLIIDACRRITEGDRIVRAGEFTGWGPTRFLGARVFGKTLGLVGFGRIGRAVAARARGFSMRVLYTSRSSTSTNEAHDAERVDLSTLLKESDVVSIHAPLTEETRELLSRERLRSMKRGAVLVNTARGPIVDEGALAELLVEGHLGGAALDVYVNEPSIDPRLLAAPRIVLAPHVGSADHETRDAMAKLACEAVRDVLEGRAPLIEWRKSA